MSRTDRNRPEHIALNTDASGKIDEWLTQIESKKKVSLSRKEFLNWLIEKTPPMLSNADLSSISEKFYDEEAFLRQLLRQVKKAKKEGQPAVLDVIVRPRKNEQQKESLSTDDQDKIPSEGPDLKME